MKTTTKGSMKQKICASCALKNTCGDLPGFCMLVPYAMIAMVVIMLTYFLVTMDL
jgi:hypothetical protein